MFLVDLYCYFDGLDYEFLYKDVDDVLVKVVVCDVKFCLVVVIILLGYLYMWDLVGECDNVVFFCGVYLFNQNDFYDVEDLRCLVVEEGVVVLGEIGLDYYYMLEIKVCQ